MDYGIKGLTIEESELVEELAYSDAYKVLINKVIPGYISRLSEKILTLNIDNTSEMHKLLLAKAHHEGAMMLLRNLESLKRSTKEHRK